MLQLLMHHVGRTDLTGISNCHVRGLHSIMLHDQDGNRIRMYVTTEGVDTQSNFLQTNEQLAHEYGYSLTNVVAIERARATFNSRMSLGLHGHRTDIRLHVLAGEMYNITADVVRDDAAGMMRKYSYISRILNPEDHGIAMVRVERYRCDNLVQTKMTHDSSVYLEAEKMHTIYVPRFAAWLVYERGAAQEDGSSFYSYNTNCAREQRGDMYQPMDSAQCQALLARVIASYQSAAKDSARRLSSENTITRARAALAGAKECIGEARRCSPSVYRETRSRADLQAMQRVTGYPRPQYAISLLYDNEWQNWCNIIQNRDENEYLTDTEFLEWVMAVVHERTSFAEVATSPSVTQAARPSVRTSPFTLNPGMANDMQAFINNVTRPRIT